MPRKEMAVSRSIVRVLLATHVFEEIEGGRRCSQLETRRLSMKVEGTCSTFFSFFSPAGVIQRLLIIHYLIIIVIPSEARLGWPD